VSAVTPFDRRALAEFVGTAGLVVAVVGSGIAAQRLSPGNVGLELLENALATGMALTVIILAVGPVSGAHLNPLISVADRLLGGISNRQLLAYVPAQIAGGVFGAVLANLMFSKPALEVSTRVRTGAGIWLGEVVATLGLILVVFGLARAGRASVTAFAVGGYLAAAYFFTSSTSFANPAVTIARMFSNSFTGIAPASVPAFVVAQCAGAALGLGLTLALYPAVKEAAAEVVVPHNDPEA
jgi:glycerol uptake facilitator-like aquaporin